MQYGPTVPFSERTHAEKYRDPNETFEQAMVRIATSLADFPGHKVHLQDILLKQKFLPAGRVQAAIGSPRQVTPYNCFVSGTIEDSFVDGEGNIMQRATEAAATMRLGGGIGYDFSTLRPRGAPIKKLASQSSGAVSFMNIFDAVCQCVASTSQRRGAQMGVLRIDHPDIEEFINAKQNSDKLNGFNISIGVTDEFMHSLTTGSLFPLRFDGEVYKWIDPKYLWEKVMTATWDWAEPGILFLDQINRMNNLWYCEHIVATNPCGEQPLPPNGACLLGSWNLVKYLLPNHEPNIGGAKFTFDFEAFAHDIPAVVRAMDNIIDRAIYPLPAQELEAKSKRRMGLGVTGLANAIEACGHAYGSEGFIKMTDSIMNVLKLTSYWASVRLAEEKGPFPLFDAERYGDGSFIATLPEDLQDAIFEHGIRNSHLISIAPAGTISITADNVSSSCEPVFSESYERTAILAGGTVYELIEDYGVKFLGVKPKTTNEVTLDEHLAVLATCMVHVDSAISKTCNVPSTTDFAEFMQIYYRAWEMGCKGITTFRIDGKRMGILKAKEEQLSFPTVGNAALAVEEQPQACYIDPVTGRRECE
jgi:ribonucleoside-diphosphate reductase alpha chain